MEFIVELKVVDDDGLLVERHEVARLEKKTEAAADLGLNTAESTEVLGGLQHRVVQHHHWSG